MRLHVVVDMKVVACEPIMFSAGMNYIDASRYKISLLDTNLYCLNNRTFY